MEEAAYEGLREEPLQEKPEAAQGFHSSNSQIPQDNETFYDYNYDEFTNSSNLQDRPSKIQHGILTQNDSVLAILIASSVLFMDSFYVFNLFYLVI